MGLLDGLFKKLPRDFNEYVACLSAGDRKEMMDRFGRLGDGEKILADLLNTPPCCLNSELDVRVNDEFLLEYKKKKYGKYPQTYLYRLDTLRYCYHSYGGMCTDYDVVGFIRKDGVSLEIMVRKSKEKQSVALFDRLRQRVRGFEEIPYTPATEENGLLPITKLYDPEEIIWCEQYHDTDGDANDPYWIKLYQRSGKTKTANFDSDAESFREVIKLKKCIPHLLYGPSESCKSLFKKDPEALMTLAKSRVDR